MPRPERAICPRVWSYTKLLAVFYYILLASWSASRVPTTSTRDYAMLHDLATSLGTPAERYECAKHFLSEQHKSNNGVTSLSVFLFVLDSLSFLRSSTYKWYEGKAKRLDFQVLDFNKAMKEEVEKWSSDLQPRDEDDEMKDQNQKWTDFAAYIRETYFYPTPSQSSASSWGSPLPIHPVIPLAQFLASPNTRALQQTLGSAFSFLSFLSFSSSPTMDSRRLVESLLAAEDAEMPYIGSLEGKITEKLRGLRKLAKPHVNSTPIKRPSIETSQWFRAVLLALLQHHCTPVRVGHRYNREELANYFPIPEEQDEEDEEDDDDDEKKALKATIKRDEKLRWIFGASLERVETKSSIPASAFRRKSSSASSDTTGQEIHNWDRASSVITLSSEVPLLSDSTNLSSSKSSTLTLSPPRNSSPSRSDRSLTPVPLATSRNTIKGTTRTVAGAMPAFQILSNMPTTRHSFDHLPDTNIDDLEHHDTLTPIQRRELVSKTRKMKKMLGVDVPARRLASFDEKRDMSKADFESILIYNYDGSATPTMPKSFVTPPTPTLVASSFRSLFKRASISSLSSRVSQSVSIIESPEENSSVSSGSNRVKKMDKLTRMLGDRVPTEAADGYPTSQSLELPQSESTISLPTDWKIVPTRGTENEWSISDNVYTKGKVVTKLNQLKTKSSELPSERPIIVPSVGMNQSNSIVETPQELKALRSLNRTRKIEQVLGSLPPKSLYSPLHYRARSSPTCCTDSNLFAPRAVSFDESRLSCSSNSTTVQNIRNSIAELNHIVSTNDLDSLRRLSVLVSQQSWLPKLSLWDTDDRPVIRSFSSMSNRKLSYPDSEGDSSDASPHDLSLWLSSDSKKYSDTTRDGSISGDSISESRSVMSARRLGKLYECDAIEYKSSEESEHEPEHEESSASERHPYAQRNSAGILINKEDLDTFVEQEAPEQVSTFRRAQKLADFFGTSRGDVWALMLDRIEASLSELAIGEEIDDYQREEILDNIARLRKADLQIPH